MGDGWGPAVLETQEEYDFIRHVADNDQFLGEPLKRGTVQAYWLGGTAVRPEDSYQVAINYTDYRPIQQTGNLC